MRKLLLCLGLVMLFAVPLLAGESAKPTNPAALPAMTWEKRDMKAIVRVFHEPITITASEDPAMTVTFRHSDHKGPSCVLCHHKVTANGERLTSCSAPGCHVLPGKSSDPTSLFQAFHSKGSERSCYGCHLEKRARFDGVKGCTTCHEQRVETVAKTTPQTK